MYGTFSDSTLLLFLNPLNTPVASYAAATYLFISNRTINNDLIICKFQVTYLSGRSMTDKHRPPDHNHKLTAIPHHASSRRCLCLFQRMYQIADQIHADAIVRR